MTIVSTATAKEAYHRFPWLKLELEPEIEAESLSEDFTDALAPWVNQALSSRGLIISESRFARQDLRIKPSTSGGRDHQNTGIKKTAGIRLKQSGFFDLGLSLLILAISGSAMYLTDSTRVENNALIQENTEVMVSLQTEDKKNVASADRNATVYAPQ